MTSSRFITLIGCLVLGLAQPLHAQFNTDRITAIGRNALYFDDYVLSIQYFNQVIKLKPYLSEPYLLRAIAKYQLGDLKGAEADCNTSIDRNPFQPGAYYTRGFIFMRTNRLDMAEKDFSEALLFAPENRTYMVLRADVRAEQGKYDQAMSDMDQLLRREPSSPSLLFAKGSICLKQNDTLCALDAFRQTTVYDSQNPSAWSALGLVLLMQDNRDEALNALTKAIGQGSKWAGDYINRGILFQRIHNYRCALADYDKAVTLAPDNAECFYGRGLLRSELGDLNMAIEDFSRALNLEPDRAEFHYQRGTILLQLRQWNDAMTDFQFLIDYYPYFLPAYYLAAQAQTALGNGKQAYDLREQANRFEQNKDSIRARSVTTNPQLASAQPGKKDHRSEFSAMAAQNQEASANENKYDSETRGSVQKHYTDVVNEPNMVLSYYAGQDKSTALRRTNYSHLSVDRYNRMMLLPSLLHFSTREVALSADMVNQHFQQISVLSDRIDHIEADLNAHRSPLISPTMLAPLYLARAIEFALVQDYSSAIDDATRATMIDGELYFAFFCRANWRYKLIEYHRAMGEKTESADFELMLRDYDYVIHNLPDFSFAYYNKANMLCIQQDFRAAISYYTRAIEQDGDFAEAYFNRGLTHIFIGENDLGIADLSKAGELGIYQAYNLITRFSK